MNVQALPKLINDAYALFDSLNLSVTSLVVIAIALTLVMLFVGRQAASWFFKIDDLKNDVRELRQLVVDLEGEIRMLQSLLSQNVAAAKEKAPETSPALVAAAASQFPINH